MVNSYRNRGPTGNDSTQNQVVARTDDYPSEEATLNPQFLMYPEQAMVSSAFDQASSLNEVFLQASALHEIFQASAPSQIFQASAPNEIFQASAPSQIFQASAPNGIFQASAPSEIFQPSAPNEIFQASAPNGIFQASAPNEIFQPSAPNEIFQPSAPNGIFQAMPFSGFDDPLGLSTSTDMSTSNWEPPQQDHEAGIVNYTGFPPAAVQGEPHLGMVATTDTNKCYVRQRWVKDSNGNIILPDAVQPQLIEAGLTNVHKTVLCAEVIAQRQQVASLVMVGRHLDAFCLALDFAKEDARGAGFYAQIYMFDYSPDMIIPGIDIMMHKWRHDPVISSYLAYYLLRGMRLRYGRLAFPDRVDMHEYGGGRARILIPYGIDNPANPESVRVRKNIVSQFTERWLSFCNGPATI